MKAPAELLAHPHATLAEALAIFDAASTVPLDFMIGRWRGAEVFTGHRLNGVLAAAGWYGKEFLNDHRAHPLLFFNRRKTGFFAVNPAHGPLWLTPPKWKVLHLLLNFTRRLIETGKPKARLRMMEARGKRTATMVYDDKPIHDYFAMMNYRTVLGMMDRKGESEPFFFLLTRDD